MDQTIDGVSRLLAASYWLLASGFEYCYAPSGLNHVMFFFPGAVTQAMCMLPLQVKEVGLTGDHAGLALSSHHYRASFLAFMASCRLVFILAFSHSRIRSFS